MAANITIPISKMINWFMEQKETNAYTNALSDLVKATSAEDIAELQKVIPKSYGIKNVNSINDLMKKADSQFNMFQEQGEKAAKETRGRSFAADFGSYKDTMEEEGKVSSAGDFVQQYSDRYGGIDPSELAQMQANVTSGEKLAESLAAVKQKETSEQGFLSDLAQELEWSTFGGPKNADPLADVITRVSQSAAQRGIDPNARYNAIAQIMQLYNMVPAGQETNTTGRTTTTLERTMSGKPRVLTRSTALAPKSSNRTALNGEKLTDYDRGVAALRKLESDLDKLSTQTMGSPTPDETVAMRRLTNSIREQREYLKKTFPNSSARREAATPKAESQSASAPVVQTVVRDKNGKLVLK